MRKVDTRSEQDEVVDTEQSQPPAHEICNDIHNTHEQVADLTNWNNSKSAQHRNSNLYN